MTQGWLNDAYIFLFDGEAESPLFSDRYCLETFLPGFSLVGLRGWDDFIVRNSSGKLLTVPTVPLLLEHLRPFDGEIDGLTLKADARCADRIKWYIQPLIFGGDPQSPENLTWVTLDQHVEAVVWWNHKYRELKRGRS